MQDHPSWFPFLYQQITIQNTYKQTRLLRRVYLLLYVPDTGSVIWSGSMDNDKER